MDFEAFLHAVSVEAAAVSLLEWAAVGFGLVQVLLAWRGRIENYLAGAVSAVLSILLLIRGQLYAEAGLNGYYLVMSVWGWVAWKARREETVAPAFATRVDWQIAAGIAIGGTVLLYTVLRLFTPSDVPLADGFVSAMAWAGTWMLTRRRVENWLVLNFSNLVAVPLQWHKGLHLYALFTALLFVIACLGYRDWRRAALAARETSLKPGLQ